MRLVTARMQAAINITPVVDVVWCSDIFMGWRRQNAGRGPTRQLRNTTQTELAGRTREAESDLIDEAGGTVDQRPAVAADAST